MSSFAKILKELMEEKPIGAISLAKSLEISNPSTIYEWLRGEKSLFLPTAVKIADFFDCSLDYLFGRSKNFADSGYKECPPFDIQFRKVLTELKVSQYSLCKDKVISGGHINSWLNKKQTPHIESIIKLADYLNVSMDYIAGRE